MDWKKKVKQTFLLTLIYWLNKAPEHKKHQQDIGLW